MNKPKREGADIVGHTLVERRYFPDNRGSLLKVFESKDTQSLGFEPKIMQINLVETEQVGTIRGLHWQPLPFAEKKLVTCVKGRIYDVVVDLREESKTFLKWSSFMLDSKDNYSVLVPERCAHGLQSLVEDVAVLYVHTNDFADKLESGLNPMDPDLAILWPLRTSIISQRDTKLPSVQQWQRLQNEM
jgi:dTDP-4-dehydrorhamnose 3,5-epimerase